MYKTAYFCVSCKEDLTYSEKMNSKGRCPKCGYKHHSAAAIVATTERGYRMVKVPSGKWWKPATLVRQFI